MRCATTRRVFLIGEDIGRYGGTYAVTRGLSDEFGPERVRDAPLSESAFVGAGIGAAIERHAADRRDHDGQLQPARARSDREQRGDAAPHVRRPDRGPARDPHGDRGRPSGRGPALAQPGELVRARPRPPGGRTGHGPRRARHAGDRAPRARSGGHLRARPALRAGGRARPTRRRSTSTARRSGGRAATPRSSRTAARCRARWRRPPRSPRTASTPR